MPLYRAELLAKKPLRYAALIHDVSQVLHLPFDYDDGSYARDRSGYGNHGTIYGATGTDGKIGIALSFDGVDDYVEVPYSTTLDLKTSWTVEAWIKHRDVSTPIRQEYVRGIDTAGAAQYYMLLEAGTILIAFYNSVYGWYPLNSGFSPSNNIWYNVAGSWDGTTLRIYVNGELKNSGVPGFSPDKDLLKVRIGMYDPSRPMNGPIDEVRIYNRALSAAEIRILMHRRLV